MNARILNRPWVTQRFRKSSTGQCRCNLWNKLSTFREFHEVSNRTNNLSILLVILLNFIIFPEKSLLLKTLHNRWTLHCHHLNLQRIHYGWRKHCCDLKNWTAIYWASPWSNFIIMQHSTHRCHHLYLQRIHYGWRKHCWDLKNWA
jgi:hypothetical protein